MLAWSSQGSTILCMRVIKVIAIAPHNAGPCSLVDPLGFSSLWFEPRSGHMWESQVLLMDGQVVFPRILRFLPTFDE